MKKSMIYGAVAGMMMALSGSAMAGNINLCFCDGGNSNNVSQSGYKNKSVTFQKGSGNYNYVRQDGYKNKAVTKQSGGGNTAVTVQKGTGNSSTITQSNNSISVGLPPT